MPYRTRFAPSPTGSLHVGGARTALYCWLVARAHRAEGGAFLLRIEDTDQARSTEEAAAGILRDMTWLGLDWDEGPGRDPRGIGPFHQSARLPRYDAVVAALREAGRAYDAWETPDELAALRDAAQAASGGFRYRRRPLDPARVATYAAEGRTPVVRFSAPTHDWSIDDAVLGEVRIAEADLDDFVIRKADGFPTYHLGVVADDHAMGVDLVIRGQEHLLNTPKHLGLYEALGWPTPRHAHLPLIFNATGGKMSKRDKAKAARAAARAHIDAHGFDDLLWHTGMPRDEVEGFVGKQHDGVATAERIAGALEVELPLIEVMDFRRAGFLPEGLLNYLALLGWSAGDDVEFYPDLDALVAAFDLGRVQRTPARFDAAKLAAIQKQHVMAASLDRLHAVFAQWLEVVPAGWLHARDPAWHRDLLAVYQPRITTFADLFAQAAFLQEAPAAWDDKAVTKHIRKGGGVDRLRAARPVLAATPWTDDALTAAFQALADAGADGKVGKVIQPVRIAITGTGVSPGIEDTLRLLGREATLARVDALLAWLDANP